MVWIWFCFVMWFGFVDFVCVCWLLFFVTFRCLILILIVCVAFDVCICCRFSVLFIVLLGGFDFYFTCCFTCLILRVLLFGLLFYFLFVGVGFKLFWWNVSYGWATWFWFWFMIDICVCFILWFCIDLPVTFCLLCCVSRLSIANFWLAFVVFSDLVQIALDYLDCCLNLLDWLSMEFRCLCYLLLCWYYVLAG